MKFHIDPVVSSRIRDAWAALSPDVRNRIAPLLAKANQQALAVSQTRTAPLDPDVLRQALFARSAISGDREPLLANLAASLVIDVGPGGEIWGTGKYEELDAGWAESVAVWLENLISGKHPFNPGPPAVITMPAQVTIALAGDWGTGDWRTEANPAPSTDVASQIEFLQPHYNIHLGDVYYAGTTDEEQHLLIKLWPAGQLGALALNSNHEMYSGAKPYFQRALKNQLFSLQNGSSFFALENQDWVIVGLDSAYYTDAEGLYLEGSLSPPNRPRLQVDFLRTQADKGKKVIVLTHHNGLSEDGMMETKLWSEVMSAFPQGSGPAYWYWGHVHAGVVYKPYGPVRVLCRCCGHGGIPWGHAAILKDSPNIEWYENRSAYDPEVSQRVLNGFALLKLDGPTLREIFYDENGGIAWQS
jgi:hypothetical protein